MAEGERPVCLQCRAAAVAAGRKRCLHFLTADPPLPMRGPLPVRLQYALLGASMGCSFVAVEPVPLFRALLELNIQLNPGLPATGTVLPYAVGLENKGIQMQVGRASAPPAVGLLCLRRAGGVLAWQGVGKDRSGMLTP